MQQDLDRIMFSKMSNIYNITLFVGGRKGFSIFVSKLPLS